MHEETLLLENNIEKYLHDLGVGKKFFNTTKSLEGKY